MKYNLHHIMKSAWKFFRKGVESFAKALRMAWANEKVITAVATKVNEETHTWAGWKALGMEVIHESKALFKVLVSDPSTKSGTKMLAYFGASQVQTAT